MMTLGIHYLTGCAVATDRTMSDRPEFPPHFGRVFMALAATYFETRGDKEERAALEWLETARAPSIQAGDGYPRRASGGSRYEVVKTYVPVNDKLDADARTFPVPRSRQSRSFPTMRLRDPFVYLKWDSSIPGHLRGAMERLCNKVTRIGHSSSLVQMWVADGTVAADTEWQPSNGISDLRMRVAEPGTLAYLEHAFNAKAIEEYSQLSEALETATGKRRKEIKTLLQRFPKEGPTSRRPLLTGWQGYTKLSKLDEKCPIQLGPFDPNLIILTRKTEQRVLGMEATLQLASALRDAAMKAVGQNVPEWLNGHQPDGRPSLKPHAAFFPLPFVGAKYADGHIMGLAMAFPREIEAHGETKEGTLRRVIGSLLFRENGEEKTIRLWRNNGSEPLWEWDLEREARDYPPVTLRANTWTGPSTKWASVTPVVLHHYPKRRRTNDVERILLEAFESAGLPRPVEMRVQPVSVFEGASHVKSMPEFAEGGEKLCRYQVHVVVRFSSRMEGPVLVGRGRFRGYGLLRPVGVDHG
jgi:CRISPR-associated protein Csb2